jgi:hypothetical protein
MTDVVIPTFEQTVYAWVNLVLCLMVAWSCVCRITPMSGRTTRTRFRVGYAVMIVGAASSGASPVLWGEYPGRGDVTLALAVLCVIGAGYGSWKHGVPDYAKRLGRRKSPRGGRRITDTHDDLT